MLGQDSGCTVDKHLLILILDSITPITVVGLSVLPLYGLYSEKRTVLTSIKSHCFVQLDSDSS